MARQSPFRHSRTEPEVGGEVEYAPMASGYESPGSTADAPYNDYPGWSPTMRKVPGNTPDPARLGESPLRDYRPNPAVAPQDSSLWESLDSDPRGRNASAHLDIRIAEDKGVSTGRRFAPNPRETPPAESRVTQSLSPSTWRFWRPFGTNQPKSGLHRFTGDHFSMADHRREYDILGMNPQRKPGSGTRNTYRLEPSPWDTNVTDVPPDPATGQVEANVYAGVPAPAPMNRSWRLS